MLLRAILPIIVFAFLASVVAAQMPNVTYKYDPDWQYPVQPASSPSSAIPRMVPPTLPGNSASIYWGSAGWNNGTVATPDVIWGLFILDGEDVAHWASRDPIPAGGTYSIWNQGPITVRGGRHTFEGAHDPHDYFLESDETDNWWAHQFVFTPYVLSESTPVSRGAPPERLGGTSSIVDGSIFGSNCDGFRFTSTGWWNAITMYATDLVTDHDLTLYAPSTGSEDGFLNPAAISGLIEGELDALIVNRNTMGVADFDVGVTRYDGIGNFVIEQVVSESAWVGMTTTASYGTDEYLKIWDTYVGDTGWITVSVTDSLNTGIGFKLGWLNYDETEIALMDVPSWELSDDNGEIRLHRDITTVGYYGLVIYRDPVEGDGPVDLTLTVEPTPPDLVPYQPNLWHSALVPTPLPVPTGMDPFLPDTLYGYMPETYINFGLHNNSHAPSPPSVAGVYLDGMDHYFISYGFPALIADDHWDINDGVAYEFPGGRHTLTVETDILEGVHEIYEANNFYGEQYCWSPLELSLGWEYSHDSPGNISGGWETIRSGEPFLFNCDGYRMYTGSTNWEGMVLTQGPNSDYDLAIHYAYSGVKGGFDDNLAFGFDSQNNTDYVLFNNNLLPAGVHDISVENLYGDEPYTVETVGSASLPIPVGGNYGPYTMPITDMLHLYNIYLDQDIYAFRLDNLAAPVDWGFALHPHDVPYQGRHEAMIGGAAYMAGPGDPEWFTVDVPVAGYYGLAVFKARPAGFDIEGEYRLTILQGVSDVPEEEDLPLATALAGVYPNPFNPRTTISYELAAAAVVSLEIYDVKGALVRRLVNESMPAGRHVAVWNGENDSGARVASGVYLARFNADRYREVMKLVMVK